MALQPGRVMDYFTVMPVYGLVISISLDAASNAQVAGNLQQTPVSNQLLPPGCNQQTSVFFSLLKDISLFQRWDKS